VSLISKRLSKILGIVISSGGSLHERTSYNTGPYDRVCLDQDRGCVHYASRGEGFVGKIVSGLHMMMLAGGVR
jgi:hypothetical protein